MKKSSIPNNSESLLLYGIVSFEKDYRLVYFINKITGIEFKKSNDLLKIEIHKKQIEVAYYEYTDFDFEYFLLDNKQNGICLVEKFKKINYWLILKQKAFEFNLAELENKINSIPVVLGCFKITDQKEKDKLSNLLFN